MTYQIRDENFGLALYQAETPAAALEAYLVEKLKGELRGEIETSEDGSAASVVHDGKRLTAVKGA